jgi:DNA-binding GntR family transcriptional regulator
MNATYGPGDHGVLTASPPDSGKGELRAPGRVTSFKSLTANVANALQHDLVTARYRPGQKLPIIQLARTYGVSPGAVREALSRLVAEGLVEFNEQRGFRAAPVSQTALADITRTRILIDVHALREAIRLGDVEWEADVLAIHHRLSNSPVHDSANPGGYGAEWQRLHRIFHRALIAACGSDWLLRFHDLLFDQIVRYRSAAPADEMARRDRSRDCIAEHNEIVRAAVMRDADAAAAALERHYTMTADLPVHAQPHSAERR